MNQVPAKKMFRQLPEKTGKRACSEGRFQVDFSIGNNSVNDKEYAIGIDCEDREMTNGKS